MVWIILLVVWLVGMGVVDYLYRASKEEIIEALDGEHPPFWVYLCVVVFWFVVLPYFKLMED